MATNNSANFDNGTSGQVLTSNGASSAPTFQTPSGGIGNGSMANGSIFRAQAAGTGTLAISGLGFQPKFIQIFGTSQTSANGGTSWGNAEDGGNESCVYRGQQGSAGGTANRDTSNIVSIPHGTTTQVVANINSYDSDGFTLNFTTNNASSFLQWTAFK